MPATALSDAQTPEELFTLLNAGAFFKLDGLVAVVTGGASGIGLMIATTLLANGAVVHIVDRAKEDLENVKRIYSTVATGRLFVHEADASLKSEAARVADAVAASSPYVNMLFNNAGISGPAVPVPWGSPSTDAAGYAKAFNALDEDSFNSVFAVNTIGPYFFSVAFLPLLCASKTHSAGKQFAPQIVNTCSLNSWSKDLRTSYGRVPYNLSKAALHHLTLTLAHEFASLQVRVNGFAPGHFVTGMTSSGSGRTPLGFSPGQQPPFVDEESKLFPGFKIPVQELGRFEDLSGLALMLATNRFINGEVVLIDGGSLLRHPAH